MDGGGGSDNARKSLAGISRRRSSRHSPPKRICFAGNNNTRTANEIKTICNNLHSSAARRRCCNYIYNIIINHIKRNRLERVHQCYYYYYYCLRKLGAHAFVEPSNAGADRSPPQTRLENTIIIPFRVGEGRVRLSGARTRENCTFCRGAVVEKGREQRNRVSVAIVLITWRR